MAQYEYTGCVTGFSESGVVHLIQPQRLPLLIKRAQNNYTNRLLGMKILRFIAGNDTFRFDGTQKFDGTAKFA